LLTIWLIFYGIGPIFGKAGSVALALVRGHAEPDLDPVLILFGYIAWILPAAVITTLAYILFRIRGSVPLVPLLLAGGVLSYVAMVFFNFLAPQSISIFSTRSQTSSLSIWRPSLGAGPFSGSWLNPA